MENATKKDSGLRVKVQHFGTKLSGMVMPNIGAFIAWGLITCFFIPAGWFPNAELAKMVAPMITYLLPILIGYTGGHMVYGQRGAVVGAVATMGVVVGTDVPMFIGAMMMGPLGGYLTKRFDEVVQPKVRAGFEMLVNNFSAGFIGFFLAILGFYIIGPVVKGLSGIMGDGVNWLILHHLLPLANIIIEPAKVLFLNNAIGNGILVPLGAQQAATAGKSVLFLLESNPGPGLGVLLAYTIFGRGTAKSTAPGAIIIQFFGGIHEIYFPYVMMKPKLFLAVIAGGVSGTFTFQLFGAGLQAVASPGSILTLMAMSPRHGHLAVLAGVFVAAAVSFLVASALLKTDKSEDDDFEATQASVQQAKAQSKGQAVDGATIGGNAASVANQDMGKIDKIIFACDAGMGSSAMGASILRNKAKEAGLPHPVTNSAVRDLNDDSKALIVTQEELHDRAVENAPSATFVSVENFMNSPRYDEIVEHLKAGGKKAVEAEAPSKTAEAAGVGVAGGAAVATKEKVASDEKVDEDTDIKQVTFAYDKTKGSSSMGATILRKLFKQNDIETPIETTSIAKLKADETTLVVTTEAETAKAKEKAGEAQHMSLENVVTEGDYNDLVAKLKAK
ncbi:MAG: PTS mannitol transporter subunit IICBA [Micrococcaceae bacterium]